MAIGINASGEGVTRSYASGLPAMDGPLTILWWGYSATATDDWQTFFSWGPQTYDGNNYYSHAISDFDFPDGAHLFTLGIDGADAVSDPDTPTAVTPAQWYAMAFRREDLGATYSNKLYLNLPTITANVTVIDHETAITETGSAGDEMLFGNTPWASDVEYIRGRIAGIKIFTAALTEAQIISEATRPELVNAGLAGSLWALIPCPTADDLTDHSGNGRDFSSKGGTLTTEADPPYAPLEQIDVSVRGLG